MNAVTELFVQHLQRSPALDDVETWVADLAADNDIQSVQAATLKYMVAINRELLHFIATIDVAAAAVTLQE
jgi:hypothetical protein